MSEGVKAVSESVKTAQEKVRGGGGGGGGRRCAGAPGGDHHGRPQRRSRRADCRCH